MAGDTLTIDATRKGDDTRPPLERDPAIVRLVAQRWREYGFLNGNTD
jgi:hypothetical protein